MKISDADIMATFCELTALAIADSYQKYAPPTCKLSSVIIAGGGAKNLHLMSRINFHLNRLFGGSVIVTTHEALGINRCVFPSFFRKLRSNDARFFYSD